MRVVIDGRCIPNQIDGTGRAAINIIRSISDRKHKLSLTVLVRTDLSETIRDKLRGHAEMVDIPYRHIHPYTVFRLGPIVDKFEADLFFSPFMLQPLRMKTPGVITLHDTMWFDRAWTQAQGRPIRMLVGKIYFRTLVELSARRACKMIVPSYSTLNDLARFWPNRECDCRVIYHGIDKSFTSFPEERQVNEQIQKFGLTKHRFFLHVTNGKPYKNTPRVIEAFMKIAGTSEQNLVIVGRKSAFTDSIRRLSAVPGLGERINFLGSVEDEDVVALYRSATALIFPSLFEGFGLPIVEAMACGCPVITSTRGSLAEISGNASVIVDPENVDKISDAMITMEMDHSVRFSCIEKGLERSRHFSWDAAAEEIVSVFRGAVSES
jgi:glycosyltransferase involved in cell wall biosynthesis